MSEDEKAALEARVARNDITGRYTMSDYTPPSIETITVGDAWRWITSPFREWWNRRQLITSLADTRNDGPYRTAPARCEHCEGTWFEK